MKNKYLKIVLILASAAFVSCTKHDPFDNYPPKGPIWILSCFESENYSDRNTNNFFSYADLVDNGLLQVSQSNGGGYFRVPTSGELQMIFPKFEDMEIVDRYSISLPLSFEWLPTEDIIIFNETAYLENNNNGSVYKNGETVSGESRICYITDPDSQYLLNFALRFKGTSQYAAYRYELKELSYNSQYILINLKAKWLKADDTSTTMEDIVKQDYWDSDYFELNIPLEFYNDGNNIFADRCGLLSSTLEYGSPVIGCYDWELAGMDKDNSEDLYKYNLRMIGCNQEGEPVSRINEGK
ncbi:MAG: hypothetical protein IKC17_01710 [Bacteroidales bacterium]|nr:hypothetical protein [Bacteroidales bacterium]